MNYEQKNGNITIDRETARVLNSAVAIYKSHLINELCLENNKKQKDMRQILYIENSLCEAVQIGQELQQYIHTPIDED